MVHAFPDADRKEAVRALAARVRDLETKAQRPDNAIPEDVYVLANAPIVAGGPGTVLPAWCVALLARVDAMLSANRPDSAKGGE